MLKGDHKVNEGIILRVNNTKVTIEDTLNNETLTFLMTPSGPAPYPVLMREIVHYSDGNIQVPIMAQLGTILYLARTHVDYGEDQSHLLSLGGGIGGTGPRTNRGCGAEQIVGYTGIPQYDYESHGKKEASPEQIRANVRFLSELILSWASDEHWIASDTQLMAVMDKGVYVRDHPLARDMNPLRLEEEIRRQGPYTRFVEKSLIKPGLIRNGDLGKDRLIQAMVGRDMAAKMPRIAPGGVYIPEDLFEKTYTRPTPCIAHFDEYGMLSLLLNDRLKSSVGYTIGIMKTPQ